MKKTVLSLITDNTFPWLQIQKPLQCNPKQDYAFIYPFSSTDIEDCRSAFDITGSALQQSQKKSYGILENNRFI